MRPVVPKFKVPLELSGSSFAVIEQDSTREVEQCIEAIVRTPIGDYLDNPELGVPDFAFRSDGSDDLLLDAISDWEPRATTTVTAEEVDELLDRQDIDIRLDRE